jgi:hypothetical protein
MIFTRLALTKNGKQAVNEFGRFARDLLQKWQHLPPLTPFTA